VWKHNVRGGEMQIPLRSKVRCLRSHHHRAAVAVFAAALLLGVPAWQRSTNPPKPVPAPPAPEPPAAPAADGSIPNPFRELGGAWIWQTWSEWKSVLWYAPHGAERARPVAVMELRQPWGFMCEYSVSPDGRWLLYNWNAYLHDPGPEDHLWILYCFRTGERLVIPSPRRASLESPVWEGPRSLVFLRGYSKNVYSTSYRVFRLTLPSLRLRAIARQPKSMDSRRFEEAYRRRFDRRAVRDYHALLAFPGLGAGVPDSRVHDSRWLSELCLWDHRRDRLTVLGEGSHPIRVPSAGGALR
jgi:hypothetical protein